MLSEKNKKESLFENDSEKVSIMDNDPKVVDNENGYTTDEIELSAESSSKIELSEASSDNLDSTNADFLDSLDEKNQDLDKKYEKIVIEIEEAGLRLDRVLSGRYPFLTNGLIHAAIRKGKIRLNDEMISAGFRVSIGQEIGLAKSLIEGIEVKKMPGLEVSDEFVRRNKSIAEAVLIFENDNLMVFNKPSGISAQSGFGVSLSVDKLAACLHRGDGKSPKLTHRLDKRVSGAMIIAKTLEAAQDISRFFRNREARKEYLVAVDGIIEDNHQRTISQKLGVKTFGTEDRIVPDGSGMEAITEIEVCHVNRDADLTVLIARPITGRRHQIRAHLSFIGHPIIGDRKYGGSGRKRRPMLHALFISIPGYGSFFADPPTDIKEYADMIPDKVDALKKEALTFSPYHSFSDEELLALEKIGSSNFSTRRDNRYSPRPRPQSNYGSSERDGLQRRHTNTSNGKYRTFSRPDTRDSVTDYGRGNRRGLNKFNKTEDSLQKPFSSSYSRLSPKRNFNRMASEKDDNNRSYSHFDRYSRGNVNENRYNDDGYHSTRFPKKRGNIRRNDNNRRPSGNHSNFYGSFGDNKDSFRKGIDIRRNVYRKDGFDDKND